MKGIVRSVVTKTRIPSIRVQMIVGSQRELASFGLLHRPLDAVAGQAQADVVNGKRLFRPTAK